jgi:hypothetical protein
MLSALNSRTFLLLGTGVKPLTNAKKFVVSIGGVGKGEQGRGVPKEFTKFEQRLRESPRDSRWRVFIVWRALARV